MTRSTPFPPTSVLSSLSEFDGHRLTTQTFQQSDVSHSNNKEILTPDDGLAVWKLANVAGESSPDFLSGSSMNE